MIEVLIAKKNPTDGEFSELFSTASFSETEREDQKSSKSVVGERRLFLGRIIFSYDAGRKKESTLSFSRNYRADQWWKWIRPRVSAMNFSAARTDEHGI